jgi:3,4-dehydroadipyl-CoA semialdehyde dehydrogenase
MTIKAGQKCTAIRRVIVPAAFLKDVADAICEKLDKVMVGDPRHAEVRMGPLVNRSQQRQALHGIAALKTEARVLFGDGTHFIPRDADPVVGAFVQPTLLVCDDAATARRVHEVEVFGPVATLLAYSDEQQAFDLARRGGGSLVASVFSANPDFSGRATLDLSDSNGRVLCVSEAVGQTQTGHGNVMPMCLHGGPGRAGGGQELGGLRALAFYHHRFALQSSSKGLEEFAVQSANYAI